MNAGDNGIAIVVSCRPGSSEKKSQCKQKTCKLAAAQAAQKVPRHQVGLLLGLAAAQAAQKR